jgi:hypothetical protein
MDFVTLVICIVKLGDSQTQTEARFCQLNDVLRVNVPLQRARVCQHENMPER